MEYNENLINCYEHDLSANSYSNEQKTYNTFLMMEKFYQEQCNNGNPVWPNPVEDKHVDFMCNYNQDNNTYLTSSSSSFEPVTFSETSDEMNYINLVKSQTDEEPDTTENLVKRNARERRRVQAVNQAFTKLRCHIPVVPLGRSSKRRDRYRRKKEKSANIYHHSVSDSPQKMFTFPIPTYHSNQEVLSLEQHSKKRISKVRTLKMAIDYIQFLMYVLFDSQKPTFISNEVTFDPNNNEYLE